MKIRKIIACAVVAAVFMLTGCSENAEQKAEDAALQQKLIGVWLYTDSAQYDENGDLVSFSAFQFTDQVAKRHDVTDEQIMSYAVDKYTIENGKFTVVEDGRKVYAVIEIKEVDGKDHLFWNIDSGGQEFIRMTEDEIEEYHIPAGDMLSSEADLLGIETTAATDSSLPILSDSSESSAESRSETETETETGAETEAAAETSAASEE